MILAIAPVQRSRHSKIRVHIQFLVLNMSTSALMMAVVPSSLAHTIN